MANKIHNIIILVIIMIGVIIYVCLSGVFPFDESFDLLEQLSNLTFLFPPDPWDNLSNDGKLILC